MTCKHATYPLHVLRRTRVRDVRALVLLGMLRRAGKALSKDAEDAEWRAVDRTKRRTELPLIVAGRRLFDDQKEEVVSRMQEMQRARSVLQRIQKDPLVVSQIFDLQEWEEETEGRFRPLLRGVMQEGFSNGTSRVGVTGVDWTSDHPIAREVLEATVRQTRGINQTTSDKLTRVIQDSVSGGDDWSETTRKVGERFDQWKGWRASAIAETGATSVFEAGQQQAFDETGVEKKKWLSTRDGNVRAAHWEADGQVVGIAERFTVMNELLRFPGDPAGRAENVIRCRCTSSPVM